VPQNRGRNYTVSFYGLNFREYSRKTAKQPQKLNRPPNHLLEPTQAQFRYDVRNVHMWQGEMCIVSLIDQEDIIERILGHFGL
jgi:hypothetical protein